MNSIDDLIEYINEQIECNMILIKKYGRPCDQDKSCENKVEVYQNILFFLKMIKENMGKIRMAENYRRQLGGNQ